MCISTLPLILSLVESGWGQKETIVGWSMMLSAIMLFLLDIVI